MMNIALGIAVLILLILYIKYSNLKEKYKLANKNKLLAENSAAIYFNTLLQYRDVIIRNNLDVPGDIPQTPKGENGNSYNMDDILDEIAEKGIDNVSEDKLNFLRNKQNGKN